ncbi:MULTISPECIES: diguanylate cyclase [unclassified Sulfuricurvum]|uniref:diguanylate cyclase n=1 Tax=unclassified Sulfuricurvum TaxID=2632390 RepID=UPI00029976BB|nr:MULTISPECIES: diguanylate cyclase [unclassified Sulfuricurvum]AFV97082.1 diguanylate cyclase/phosphodiesterase with extracellular sensor [Candidatus Sulfuricurvum sp. RIFRC-1]HBM35352.1 GGDEF domain-containing protein [Sulfuricurvum sp.]
MKSYTTYKRLIAKTVILSLVASLAVAFVYGVFIKKRAIDDLARVDARKTSRLAFEALYSAMEKGWSKEELDAIILRLNKVEPNMRVNAYRSPIVSELFGERPQDKQIREHDPMVLRAMKGEEILTGDEEIRYLYPIVVNQECLSCHTNAKVGDINGVIDVRFPVANLKISLTTMINSFIIFFVVFTIMIFAILYFRLNALLVQPINQFIVMIQEIISKNDMAKRVSLKTKILEVKNIENYFNKMLDSIQDYYEKLQELSDRDYLTGLYNRRKFEEFLTYEIKRSVRHRHKFTILMIDLDNFKYINDTYGHASGDLVLKEVTNIFGTNLRNADILARLGGDEFAVLLPETPYENGYAVVEKLRSRLEATPISLMFDQITLTASFGIAEYPEQGENIESLLTGSDLAMYKAKRAGKNTIARADQSDQEMAAEIQKKGEFLRRAIDEDRVEPFIQSIYHVETGKLFGYEVLARIRDGKRYMAAGQFIEVAESLGFASKIDQIILTKGLRIREEKGWWDKRFFFNLSTNSLFGGEYVDLIQAHYSSNPMPSLNSGVTIEILEREAIHNVNGLMEIIESMKNIGISFALDDFGSGFSSFVYLKYFDTEYVKIDGEFVKNITVNEKDRIFVKHIHQIAKEFGKQTIAEYVEDEETLEVLREIGVDYAQGYHYGRPELLA